MAFTRRLLSGSTSGRPIPVAATATPGTLIHTAVAGADVFDEIYLSASNSGDVAIGITIEWGGTSSSDHVVKDLLLPGNCPLYTVVPGLVLNGGLAVRAFATVANVVRIGGFVNRIV